MTEEFMCNNNIQNITDKGGINLDNKVKITNTIFWLCVIAIIWLGQKVGREQDGLKG
jgi:hypothetical protein